MGVFLDIWALNNYFNIVIYTLFIKNDILVSLNIAP
jgi:hypothetical protein